MINSFLRLVLFFSSVILAVSCSPKERGFNEYLYSLDELKVPITLDINSTMTCSLNYDSALFQTYKHVWSVAPYGIAYKTNSFVGIVEYGVADNGLAPFLITFDSLGNKIDSLNILGNTGYGEQGQTVESAVLYKDLQIVITDSSKSWQNDIHYDIIPNSVELKVSKTTYQILENGKIEKH